MEQQWGNADYRETKQIIIRNVLMRAIQHVHFIEFEPLCHKLWVFLSNFGIFLRWPLTKYGHVT